MDELIRNARLTLAGMWRFRRLGLLTAWGVGALGLAAITSMPAKYEATARIFVNTDSILKPLMTGLTVQPNEDQRILMLSRVVISRPNVEQLVQKVGLDAEAKTREERERVVDTVMKTLEFKGGGRENLYSLTFRDVDPGRAKQAIDLLASMFIESSRGGKSQDTETAKKFIDEQIAIYDKKLQEAENRLKEFRLRYLGISPGDGKDYFVRMSETSNLLNQARLELREAERARDAFKRGLAAEDTGPSTGASVPSAAVAEIDARLDVMRRNLDSMLQRYTEGHPDVVGAKRVIRELEAQRKVAMATRGPGTPAPSVSSTAGPRASETLKVSLAQAEAAVASLSIRVAEYNERYNRLKASAALVPQLEAELAQLNRDYDVNKKNYESLVARRESATISGDMQTVAGVSDFRLVDPPRVSPRPVSPNRRLLLPLALLLSLVAGIGSMYIAHEARPAIFDGRTLREATGLPLVGTVSAIQTDASRRHERASMLRLAGGVAMLLGVYATALIALEFLAVPYV